MYHKTLNLWNLGEGYCNACIHWESNCMLTQYKVCRIGYTSSKHGEGFPENAKHKRPKKCDKYENRFKEVANT